MPYLQVKWKQEKLTLRPNKLSPLMETKMEKSEETETKKFGKIDLFIILHNA